MNDQSGEAALWTTSAVQQALGAGFCGAQNAEITGISIDSRTVDDKGLFFAIKGDRFDGHDFVVDVLKNNSVFAVISKAKAATIKTAPDRLFIVDDVLQAMETLARAARVRMTGQVIAVTGSVGKTGTKEMLRLAFAACGRVHASVASFNNHWGVPLTLSRMEKTVDFGVFEIGMNHSGEIEALVGMVRPHSAIITTVEPVHLEFFANEQEIARAKAEIFSGVEAGGSVVLNRDNRHFELLSNLAREAGVGIVTFGEVDDADVRLLGFELHDDHCVVTADIFGKITTYVLGAPGRHVVQNSLGVAASLYLAGANVEAGLKALSALAAPKGRGAKMTLECDGGSFTVLDESYNANPASMRAAIDLLGARQLDKGGRRIAVLGDMLELGGAAERLHVDLYEALEKAKVDLVFTSGTHMKALFEVLPGKMRGKYAFTSDGLAENLLDTVAKGDVVMVKGSLGSRMGPLVAAMVSRYPATSPTC